MLGMRSPSLLRSNSTEARVAKATVLALILAAALTACPIKGATSGSNPPLADCTMSFIDPTIDSSTYQDGSGITVRKMGPVLYLAVGVAWITCVKRPNTLTIDLQLWYKPPGFNGDWREINNNSANFDINKPAISGSAMPGTKPVPVPVTAPCVAGDWQIQASALGENEHGQFILPKVTGPTSTLSSTVCHHA